MRIVAVTGATGFVGQALVARLARERAWSVRAVTRRPPDAGVAPDASAEAANVTWVRAGDLAPDGDWRGAVRGADAVVHLAARVHVMRDRAADPLAEFRRVNVEGTLALARQASEAGVRRFVFVSSVKVHGEATAPGRPFRAGDRPAPVDAYGMSKHEAELALAGLARETGLEVVVVRPVLVYGPGVRANFRAMLGWLRRGVPLPLGATRNRRSLVASANLADLLAQCLEHPAAAGRTFLAADGEDLSTAELLRRAAAALGTRARLVPVPPAVLMGAAALIGRADVMQRLCGSLQVDTAETRALLEWTAPVTVDEALAATARAFAAEGGA